MPHVARYFSQRAYDSSFEACLERSKLDYSAVCKKNTEDYIPLQSEGGNPSEFCASHKGEREKSRATEDFLNSKAKPGSSRNYAPEAHSRRESKFDYSVCKKRNADEYLSLETQSEIESPPGFPDTRCHGSDKGVHEMPRAGEDFVNNLGSEEKPGSCRDYSSEAYNRRKSKPEYPASCRKTNTEEYISLETQSEKRGSSRFPETRYHGPDTGEPRVCENFLNGLDNESKPESSRNYSSEAQYSRREDSNKSHQSLEPPETDKWRNNNSEAKFSETSTAFIGPLYQPPTQVGSVSKTTHNENSKSPSFRITTVVSGKEANRTKSEGGINYELRQFYKELYELEAAADDQNTSQATDDSQQNFSSHLSNAPTVHQVRDHHTQQSSSQTCNSLSSKPTSPIPPSYHPNESPVSPAERPSLPPINKQDFCDGPGPFHRNNSFVSRALPSSGFQCPPPGCPRLPSDIQRSPLDFQHLLLSSDFQRPPPGCPLPPSDFQRQLPPSDFQRPPPGCPLPPSDFQRQLPPSDFQRPPPGCPLPPSDFQRPPPGCPLPPSDFQRPPPGCPLPPSDFQRPPPGCPRSPSDFQRPPPGCPLPPTDFPCLPSGFQHAPSGFQRPPPDFQCPPPPPFVHHVPPPPRSNYPLIFPRSDTVQNTPNHENEKYHSVNSDHPRSKTQAPWHNAHLPPEKRFCPEGRGYTEPCPRSPIESSQQAYKQEDFWEQKDRHFSEIRLQGGTLPHEQYPLRFRDEAKCTDLIKKLVLLRGVPGSGKSTLARTLLDRSPEGIVFSTDDYFCLENRYTYDVKLLGDAHSWNQNRARRAMDDGKSPIIIDNTNIQSWEMKPYVQMAMERGYGVEFLEPNTWWKQDPHELEKRNTHRVPREKISQMLERFEHDMNVGVVMNSVEPHRVRSGRPLPEARQRGGASVDCTLHNTPFQSR